MTTAAAGLYKWITLKLEDFEGFFRDNTLPTWIKQKHII